MSNLEDDEREAIMNFMVEFYKEAVSKMEEELGRNLTVQEFEDLRDAVLKRFLGSGE